MADAFARMTGRVGLVTAQNGPAATLLVAPLAEALKASVPVIALVQEVPRGIADKNAFQELDHHGLFAAVTKAVRRIDHPDRVEDYIDHAVVIATSGRPGPVALLVPMDFLSEAPTASPVPRMQALGTFPLDRVAPDPQAVRKAASMLSKAKKPLVVAGGGVHLSRAHEALAVLQESRGLPVGTTFMGKGSVSERHPLSLGVIGQAMGEGSRTEFMKAYVKSADVILFVGTRTNQNGTDSWRLFPASAAYIQIDVDPLEIGRNYEALRVAGDARLALEALTEAMGSERIDGARRAKLETEIEKAKLAGLDGATRKANGPEMRPEALMEELDQLLSPEDIVVADASYSSVWIANGLTASKPGQRFLTPRGLAGLGWGLPFALGAKTARPNARVIAVVGDGGFGHVWSELETAVRSNLPVTVIVLNNATLGFQKHAELVRFGKHTDNIYFKPVDHAAIAKACGCDGHTVRSRSEFRAALGASLDANRTTVLDCVVGADAYPPITFFDAGLEKALATHLAT